MILSHHAQKHILHIFYIQIWKVGHKIFKNHIKSMNTCRIKHTSFPLIYFKHIFYCPHRIQWTIFPFPSIMMQSLANREWWRDGVGETFQTSALVLLLLDRDQTQVEQMFRVAPPSISTLGFLLSSFDSGFHYGTGFLNCICSAH